MTLCELIQSVDSEQYSDSVLYQKLRVIKPEYGSNRHVQVKLIDGRIAVTNAHVGSIGDILTYPIDVEPDLNISRYSFWTLSFMNCPPTVLVNRKRLISGVTLTISKKQR